MLSSLIEVPDPHTVTPDWIDKACGNDAIIEADVGWTGPNFSLRVPRVVVDNASRVPTTISMQRPFLNHPLERIAPTRFPGPDHLISRFRYLGFSGPIDYVLSNPIAVELLDDTAITTEHR